MLILEMVLGTCTVWITSLELVVSSDHSSTRFFWNSNQKKMLQSLMNHPKRNKQRNHLTGSGSFLFLGCGTGGFNFLFRLTFCFLDFISIIWIFQHLISLKIILKMLQLKKYGIIIHLIDMWFSIMELMFKDSEEIQCIWQGNKLYPTDQISLKQKRCPMKFQC